MTDLGTFGAIFKFALEFEQASIQFYSDAASKMTGLASLVDQAAKRVKTLERLRREAVTEMILEPLPGLLAADYEVDWAVGQTNRLLGQAAAIEDAAQRFYTAATQQIPIIEVTRAFKKLAKEHEAQLAALAVKQE